MFQLTINFSIILHIFLHFSFPHDVQTSCSMHFVCIARWLSFYTRQFDSFVLKLYGGTLKSSVIDVSCKTFIDNFFFLSPINGANGGNEKHLVEWECCEVLSFLINAKVWVQHFSLWAFCSSTKLDLGRHWIRYETCTNHKIYVDF